MHPERPDPTPAMLEANIRRAKRAAYRLAMIRADKLEADCVANPTVGNHIRAHQAHVQLAGHARAHGDEAVAGVHEAIAVGHRTNGWDKLRPGEEYHDSMGLSTTPATPPRQ